ncbi:CYFA0S02e05886g1_1 [Cyberlindnera fabianii]|uniref:CYFA0S02e05886g1_1 n=1 Tax=Cyberlindnera fabianii TaxID=36022 RepID=A0A061AML0_CYBFA|nr:putative lipase ROG1 [Cyberlindnera fabianii]CDR38797.1 CYFA0S02e05886g1_1 [Cyberlindnera fabianii]
MHYHLLVLVHGLWGNKNHFEYINQQIEEYRAKLSSDEQLVIYRTSDNEGYKTLDGIDVCGLRVAKEIKDQINLLNGLGDDGDSTGTTKDRVTKFSIVGYSLGGLISRYAIGILYHQGYFDTIEPVNFTTFVTPHVGVLMPGTNISVRLFNWLVPNLLSQSGKQMFLKDTSGPRQEPLLSLMANPSSLFYKALQQFKYRSLYANAINDKRTSWWTAGISVVDPFMKIDETSRLNNMDFKFVKGYDPIVIDANAKFKISNKLVEKGDSPIIQTSNFWKRKFKWVIVAVNLLLVAPLWVTWFIISGLLETYKSHLRIKGTLKDHHGIFASLCDWSETEGLFDSSDADDIDDDAVSTTGSIKAMEMLDRGIDEKFHDHTDAFMESVFDAISSKDAAESAKYQQYDIELEGQENDDTASEAVNHVPSTAQDTGLETDPLIPFVKTSINDMTNLEPALNLAENEVVKVFTLGLSQPQVEIIKNLNALNWQKFPILIRHTTSTHSAAIVRNKDEKELYEGKVVIRHWLNEVLRLE